VSCADAGEQTADEARPELEVRETSQQLVTPFVPEFTLGSEPPTAVAVSGQTIAVAYASSTLTVYTRSLGGVRQQSLTLSAPAKSLALDGDSLAAGVPGSGAGQVELFRRSIGGSWSATQTLVDESPRVGSDPPQFGYTVALRGDTLAVGQPGRNDHEGRVLLFQRAGGSFPATPVFVIAGVLEPSPCFSTTADEFFGQHVAFARAEQSADATLVVGKPGMGQACASHPDSLPGHAYVFQQTAGVWSGVPSATLDPPDPQPGARFGASLAAADGTVVVSQRGRVDAFERRAAGFVPTSFVAVPEGRFGAPAVLDFDGNTLAVAVNASVLLYDRTLTGSFRRAGTLAPAPSVGDNPGLTVAITRSTLFGLRPSLFTPGLGTLVVGVPSTAASAPPGAYVYRAIESGSTL
jgi:hypothetical protein